MEDKQRDWQLLLDTWYEFHKLCPPTSAVRAYQTTAGKEVLKKLLYEFIQNIKGPVVIAWDPQKQQVSDKTMQPLISIPFVGSLSPL